MTSGFGIERKAEIRGLSEGKREEVEEREEVGWEREKFLMWDN